MSTMTANDLLMGGGGKSATFPEIGATVTGRITAEPQVKQQTEFGSDTLKFFPNGDPMMQIVVSLQTADRDPADAEDDGVRQLYVKGQMLKAVREAVQQAGAKGLETGGTLTVSYSADGEPSKKGFNAPKLYTARYAKPTGEAANNLLMGTPNRDAAAQLAATLPSLPPPAAPAGIDPAVWGALDPSQRQAILAAQISTNTPPF